MPFPKGGKNPNAGRKKGGHNSKPTFKKPKLGHGPKKPHPNSLKNLRAPLKPGERLPNAGKKKGSGVVELHKAFMALANECDPKTKMRRIDEWFYKLNSMTKSRKAISAIQLLMAYAVGSPAQTVKILPAVDINIGLAPEVDQPDVLHADNIIIVKEKTEQVIEESHNGDGNGNGNGSSGTPAA